MKTKILSIILAVVMVVALLPLSASATSTYTIKDEFDYTDADALAQVWKSEVANYRSNTTDGTAAASEASVSVKDNRSVLIAPMGTNTRQTHYATPISWPTDKLQKFTTVFYYDSVETTRTSIYNPSIYLMRIDGNRSLTILPEKKDGALTLSWYEFYLSDSKCTNRTGKVTNGIALDEWLTLTATYDYSVEGKVTVSATVFDGTNTVDLNSHTIDIAVGETFNAGFGSYRNDNFVYFDSATFEFEGQGEPAPEVDYNPVINGATIKREGSQDLRFNCEFGDIREDKEVAEYGLILTFKQYIDNGEVTADDMVADSTNDYVRVIKSTDVSNVAKGNEFYANVGNIYPEAYGYRYSARVYVKYADGTTVDYSDVLDRSVISVAKAMSKFAYEKQLAGIDDIVSAVDGDSITWTYDPNTDNGVTILNWIQTNQQAIVDAYNAANQ